MIFSHEKARKKKKTKQMKNQNGEPSVAPDMPSPVLRESIEDVGPQGIERKRLEGGETMTARAQ